MVVVDSSVLIYLCRVGKIDLLRKHFKEISIPKAIYDELVPSKGLPGAMEIMEFSKTWIHVKGFEDKQKVRKLAEVENIANADAELILLAAKDKDILLTNDLALNLAARAAGVEAWWLTTFILKLAKKKTLSKASAKDLLSEVVRAGLKLRIEVYEAVLDEIDNL